MYLIIMGLFWDGVFKYIDIEQTAISQQDQNSIIHFIHVS